MHAPAHIQAFNKNVKNLLKKTKQSRQAKLTPSSSRLSKDVIRQQTRFYDTVNNNTHTQATARKIVSNIPTDFETKTLNIWVSDDSFGLGCAKNKCVTQEMVDALAARFLKVGPNNDIYDWVTNIYGKEWGTIASEKYENLIDPNNEITILLTDIDNDNNENGGAIGYFYSKDNYTEASYSGSNERVMFYIDAVMFANTNGSNLWSIEDAWPKEVVGTLAHEFVHMIEFYQKAIILETQGSETWLSEMLAETTEDMVATKIQSSGPRGVVYTDGSAGKANNTDGRYGLFNAYNTISLNTWNGELADYSKVNAFGAYLTRNYGGATLLHDMMHNTSTDTQAVVAGVKKSISGQNKTFDDLQKEWGIAVMLSDQENLAVDTPSYNTGDFTETSYGTATTVTYEMGSINFFNYRYRKSKSLVQDGPQIMTTVGKVKPRGNYYYKVGDNISGLVELNLTVDSSTEATLIVK
jgi:hypothetical protein